MSNKISTGIKGFDEILRGGLIPGRAYLLQGGPGTGKSTMGYHFLQEGLRNGETTLYITLGETKSGILENTRRIGIDLSDVHFLDLTPSTDLSKETKNYNIFSSAEVEQQPLIKSIIDVVQQHNPSRIVFDSVTMLRLLNQDPFQYRNIGLSFIKFICGNGATLMMISESVEQAPDRDSTFWVDGIIRLEYAPDWRKLHVSKYRGSDFEHGNHAFRITDRGVSVFPRLRPVKYDRSFADKQLSSGIEELDSLLHGGIEKGTISLITGPSGVGKTNLGIQFIKGAASRGERSAIYTFEESKEAIVKRSESINVPISSMIETGNLKIAPIEPLSISPDEFSEMVRTDIEEHDTRIVMIDSIGGYSMAVREETALERLHSLTVYLQNMGVTGFLINETQSITGTFETTNMHASYLTDNILFLRYLETNGELLKAIGVLKKRLSDFEKSIRQFQITSDGLKVGKRLNYLRGILSGMPQSVNNR